MIIHKLIFHHLAHKDDSEFYRIQAVDAIRWMEKLGVPIRPGITALDLGAGHGVFGAELLRRGCKVTFADQDNFLARELGKEPFLKLNLDREDFSAIGQYDLVICSNVLEHLAEPRRLIERIPEILVPGGYLYLSWTNWLSLWGGHEFSPFHYFGAKRGHLIYDRLVRRQRKHTPFQNLFPTFIGAVLKRIKMQPDLIIRSIAPRYYPELQIIMSIPGLREFLAWNCVVLLQRRSS